jgi:hypothetical protein
VLAGLSFVGAWAILRPAVRIDPYVQLDPTYPFSERFKVGNEGYFSVHDVEVSCQVIKAMTRGHVQLDSISLHAEYRPALESGESTTIDCPLKGAIGIANDSYVSAEIQFSMSFQPFGYLWRKQKFVYFFGQLDSQGNVQWTY